MKPNLIDRAVFIARAGKGGDGAISFRREKYVPKGGPDGGSGGRGGSVWLRTDSHKNTLRLFAGKNKFEAQAGERGAKRKRFGEDGEDLILIVPVGTQVWVKSEGTRLLAGNPLYGEKGWEQLEEKSATKAEPLPEQSRRQLSQRFELAEPAEEVEEANEWIMIADLKEPEMEFELAKGGKGGKGNDYFKSSRETTPKYAQRGELGESFQVKLALKILADIGLVGLPNVGKSTLLSVLSNAKPEIADYPFTTLSPNLGVLSMGSSRPADGRSQDDRQEKVLTIADIPGLIEGAHQGKGLGDAFLQHIERCQVLVYVVAPQDTELSLPPAKLARALQQQLATVEHEVAAYSPAMQEKKRLVVVNKRDVISEAQQAAISQLFQEQGVEVVLISAAAHDNLDQLVEKLALV